MQLSSYHCSGGEVWGVGCGVWGVGCGVWGVGGNNNCHQYSEGCSNTVSLYLRALYYNCIIVPQSTVL